MRLLGHITSVRVKGIWGRGTYVLKESVFQKARRLVEAVGSKYSYTGMTKSNISIIRSAMIDTLEPMVVNGELRDINVCCHAASPEHLIFYVTISPSEGLMNQQTVVTILHSK